MASRRSVSISNWEAKSLDPFSFKQLDNLVSGEARQLLCSVLATQEQAVVGRHDPADVVAGDTCGVTGLYGIGGLPRWRSSQ